MIVKKGLSDDNLDGVLGMTNYDFLTEQIQSVSKTTNQSFSWILVEMKESETSETIIIEIRVLKIRNTKLAFSQYQPTPQLQIKHSGGSSTILHSPLFLNWLIELRLTNHIEDAF